MDVARALQSVGHCGRVARKVKTSVIESYQLQSDHAIASWWTRWAARVVTEMVAGQLEIQVRATPISMKLLAGYEWIELSVYSVRQSTSNAEQRKQESIGREVVLIEDGNFAS